MKLRRLRIENYRGVGRAELELPPLGVTLVSGPNEAGKSSLVEALDLLLDKKDSCRDAAVRATWPVHSDGPTLVEAQLELGARTLRYRKAFRRNPTTELEIRGPHPESWTGDEAHARVRELLEQHLDTALWRALRIEQGRAWLGLDLSGQRALSHALEQAACAVENGSESTLYGLVREEFARYFTEKRADPRKILREARADEAHAEGEVERLAGQIADLEVHIERIRELEASAADRAVTELELEVEARESRRAAAHAEELERALERVAGQLAVALERASNARRALETRLARVQANASEELALASLAERNAAERRALETRRAQAREAEAALARARAECASLAQRRDALLRTLDVERARSELARIDARLDAVAAVRAQLANAEDARRVAAMDDARLAALERAVAEREGAQARCAALDARLEIEALAPVELEIDGQSRALERGARLERSAGELDLRVPGSLHVRIWPGASLRAAREQLQHSASQLAEKLRSAEVATLEEARERNRRHRAAELESASREAELRALLVESSVAELERRQHALRERVSGRTEPESDGSACEADLAAASLAGRRAEALAQTAEQAELRARSELEKAERTQAVGDAERVARRDAAERERAALEKARRHEPDAELAQQSAARASEADALAREHARLAAEVALAGSMQTRERLARAEHALETLRAQAAQNERERLELQGLLRAKGEDGLAEQLGAAATRLHHRRDERAALERKARAARLLFEVVDAERERSRSGHAILLRDRVEELGQRVFGPELRVELDEELVLRSRTLAGRTVPFESLSVGAREQIALIARIACALAVAPDGGVPLILDDALGHSDARRAADLARLLGWAGERCQILLLTCSPERYAELPTAARIHLP